MSNKRPPLWERQPWDTTTSFDRFHRFYLSQKPPRSPLEAYRRYRLAKGSNGDRPVNLPGTWASWSQGRDAAGQPIPGAVSWAERATAWDDHQAQQDREEWEQRRAEYRRDIWAITDKARAAIQTMLDHPLTAETITETKEEEDETGRRVTVIHKTIEPAHWNVQHLARLIAETDKAARLALGEPTERSEQIHRPGDPYSSLETHELDERIRRLIHEAGLDGAEPGAEGSLVRPAFRAPASAQNGSDQPASDGSTNGQH